MSSTTTPSSSTTTPHDDPISDARAQEATHGFAFRVATDADVPALQQMIGESLRALGKGYYSEEELEGSIGYLFGVDRVLIRDETYFILHPVSQPHTICASGGWSFRRTLYGGSTAPSSLRLPAPRDPEREPASIRAIFTHPAWARRGLGTMMLRYCEQRAREGRGASETKAVRTERKAGAEGHGEGEKEEEEEEEEEYIPESKPVKGFKDLEMGATLSGVALYEKCGYVRSGKEDVFRCKNGEGVRVVHMVKRAV